jgi:hypothetical protein
MNQLPLNRKSLWQGCLYASIAHAIMVAVYPILNYEHSWDGCNYSVQDGSGARGTITFLNGLCIGAFCDVKSPRLHGDYHSAQEYFDGAEYETLKVAETETLRYLLDTYCGKIQPAITTAFWGDEKAIYSNDTLEDMMSNGGFLIERQMLNINLATEKWGEDYDMSPKQIELLNSLYERKMACHGRISLYDDDKAILLVMSKDGIEESKCSFREINIDWID